ncbi:hypothetical protein ACTFIU_005706 [Dictyostelium citrinum]
MFQVDVSNLVFDDSNSSSSSSSSSVSSSSEYIPKSINQGVNRFNSYSDTTTMEVRIIQPSNHITTELFMGSWQPSTLKVYDSNYSRFFSFCLKNSLDPSNITLVVFMDYLTYLFKLNPPLAYSTINSHRSMLKFLMFLKNQTDIAHDPFITRIMTARCYIRLLFSERCPVINAKEQRNTKSADISILELTSLEAANLSVCPVRHLATYLRCLYSGII